MTSGKFSVVISDFDGTVADTATDILWCMRETFTRFGQAQPKEDAILLTMGLPLEVAIRELCRPELNNEEASAWINCYRNIYNNRGDFDTRLYPGTRDLLRRIREAGISLLVLTNKAQVAVDRTLLRLGIRHLVGRVFGDGTTTYKKPDARLFSIEMASYLGPIKNEQVLVVGDTETDLAFARNAGLSVCWARYGYGHIQRCRELKPQFTIEAITDLENILQLSAYDSKTHGAIRP